ncbi:MAG: hypothetical protein JW821_07100 [Deltaproteobacteria bacterium]|nr:hypothetical protein [Deltaproteobacteria bacterium]
MKEHSPESILEGKDLGLNDRLSLIGLIDEGMRQGSSQSPVMADLFNDLWGLVDATVSGSRIDRLGPEDSHRGFHVFEINAETGENLGRLNMIYLKKPIPCYYLIYVEVAAPFRRKGLGNRILKHFADFLSRKSALGLLDNIIPEEDSTYTIYFKHAWESVDSVIGNGLPGIPRNYMVFVPTSLQGRDLRDPLVKLVYHLERKRTAIDMRENEMMVRRTIEEFKDLYRALCIYFEKDLEEEAFPPLMRFMFTRFATKLIAFRRRIATLIGYTGGESMEQIVLDPKIGRMPAKSYAPRSVATRPSLVTGEKALWLRLSEELKREPASFIEALPNYRRPSLTAWLKERGYATDHVLTIGDLMDLGFDPTRLKEIAIDGEPHIFERIQARQIPALRRRKDMLQKAATALAGATARGARLRANVPLMEILDRGNGYILHRKIPAVHWEEALEQLHGAPHLKGITMSTDLDRIVAATVREANAMAARLLGIREEMLLDHLTYFVPWDLEGNRPRVMIEFGGTFLPELWIA